MGIETHVMTYAYSDGGGEGRGPTATSVQLWKIFSSKVLNATFLITMQCTILFCTPSAVKITCIVF